jgi:predicted  nucleic acid-binding Zn-ribbon protein
MRTQTTIRLNEELIEELDNEAEKMDVSRSEYVRNILQKRGEADELREKIDSLQERLESREQRINDLEQQLAQRRNIEEKIEDLPDKVREVENEPEPPFFVSWVRWWRNRK